MTDTELHALRTRVEEGLVRKLSSESGAIDDAELVSMLGLCQALKQLTHDLNDANKPHRSLDEDDNSAALRSRLHARISDLTDLLHG